jgi:hypothetical protein
MREDQSYRIKNNIGERKIMKTKSLFISTIAMVVMLIVALSVGTFAWYTAQETVTADNAVVGTATSTESAIAIGWTAGASSSSVSFGAKNDLRPMIPTSAPTSGASLPSFQEAHLELQGTDRIIKNVVSATPWSQVAASGDPAASTTLFVKNLSETQDVNVYPVVTIDPHQEGDNPDTPEITETDWVGDLNHLLRVAIWVSGGESTYTHLGTWGSETVSSAYAVDMNNATYLNQNENLVKDNDNKITLTSSGSRVADTTFQLTATQEKQIYIRAWIEGTALTSGLSGLSAGFDVTFSVDAQPVNAQP